jgi:hypothetical protein
MQAASGPLLYLVVFGSRGKELLHWTSQSFPKLTVATGSSGSKSDSYATALQSCNAAMVP